MKTLMVSQLWQLYWAKRGIPGLRVRWTHRGDSGTPNPGPRGRLLQRDNFLPAPRSLPILQHCLARNPRARMGTRVASPPGSPARGRGEGGGSGRELQVRWRSGQIAPGMGVPKSNSLPKTKRDGEEGPLQTFFVFLDFKLARIAKGESPRAPGKERC